MHYEAWTGCKSDVSHLQISSSLDWAYIPKQVQKGKLESRAVKVCLLGQQTDEAKGYQLENLECGKLIASLDIQFFENNIPSDLAVIGIDTPKILTIVVDKLVNDVLAKENVTTVAQSNSRLTHIISDTIPTNIVDQNHTPEIVHSITPINNVTSEVPSSLPPIQKKTSKWDYLSRKDVSTYVYKLAECYGLLAINDAITLDGSVNLTFIAVTNEPRTYYEALYSLYSSE